MVTAMLHVVVNNLRIAMNVGAFVRHLMFQCCNLAALMSNLLLSFARAPPIAVPACRAALLARFAKLAEFLAQLRLIAADLRAITGNVLAAVFDAVADVMSGCGLAGKNGSGGG